MGVDVFIECDEDHRDAQELGRRVEALAAGSALTLTLITHRGVKVYPNGFPETYCTDHWRCRFKGINGQVVTHSEIIDLLNRFNTGGFDVIKTEHLVAFDGKPAFSQGQGE